MKGHTLKMLEIYSKAVQQELANQRLSTTNDDEQRALIRVEEAFRQVELRLELLVKENE